MERVLKQPQYGNQARPQDQYPRSPSHSPPSELGHWVRTAGILAPLVIGEIVKDPERKWRFVRITSVAVALISEGLHARRIHRERQERDAQRQR
jgi:hypothetical protein